MTATELEPPVIQKTREMFEEAKATRDEAKKTTPLTDKNVLEKMPLAKGDLEELAYEFLHELSQPIKIGRWYVTDVLCEYVHYFLISDEPYEIAVWKNKTRAPIMLYGLRMEVNVSDIWGKRMGYLPHLFEPESIPAMLLMGSGRMVHHGITARAVTKAFTKEDMKQILEGVEEYQTGILRAYAVDLKKQAKEWMMIANRRVLDAKAMTEMLIKFWLLLMRLVDERLAKQAGGLAWTTRIKNFVVAHKKASAIIIIVIIAFAALIGFLWWNFINVLGGMR